MKAYKLSVGMYHGKMSRAARARTHQMFSDGEISVVVSTIAFAMGIDKSNVRWGE